MSPYFKNHIEGEVKTAKDLAVIREVRLYQRTTVPSKSLVEHGLRNEPVEEARAECLRGTEASRAIPTAPERQDDLHFDEKWAGLKVALVPSRKLHLFSPYTTRL
jgi:hypothetical protein